MHITSERLAYWFLRLNGFLTIENFVVHPEPDADDPSMNQRTDVDILGVRFPFRLENPKNPMQDFEKLVDPERCVVVLGEVKSGVCNLNQTWTDPSKKNLEKILNSGGFQPRDLTPTIAAKLYKCGVWTNPTIEIKIVSFGKIPGVQLKADKPDVLQLTWDQDVLPFIYTRFRTHQAEKRSNGQWEAEGRELFDTVERSTNQQDFSANVTVASPNP